MTSYLSYDASLTRVDDLRRDAQHRGAASHTARLRAAAGVRRRLWLRRRGLPGGVEGSGAIG